MARFAVILPAAGKSSRFAHPHYKKPFAPLADRAVWLHSVERFIHRPDVCQVILVVADEDREYFDMKFGANVAIHNITLVSGGAERVDSVSNALAKLCDEADYVAVHDAARPLISSEWIDAVFAKAEETGAAMLAVPVVATLKRVGEDQVIQETVSRANLWEAQTPQVFRRDWLEAAYAQRGDRTPTDDSQLVEALGHPVSVVMGSPINFKITTEDDLNFAEHALGALPQPRIDRPIHPFADDDLWR
jgi:2-C-methyl-D-erythritol 4-phosphate cytidylyltransferase